MIKTYAVVFAATVFILIYCVVRASYYQKKIAAAVRRVLTWAILAVFASIVLLYVKNARICSAVYSVYFISIDWMLYYLLVFVKEYAGYGLKRPIYKTLLCFLLWLDTISICLNTWLGHVFGCRQILLGGTEIYYEFEPYLCYNIHLSIAYIIMALVLICLIYKAWKAPSFYRRKYLMVLFSVMVIVLLDAVYLFISNGVDMAILFYALAGISIYYFALVYSPKEPLNKTLAGVVHNMGDALFILDMEDICIYTNASAESFFDIHEGERLTDKNAFLAKCLDYKESKLKENKTEGDSADQTVASGGREYYLRMQCRRLEDKKGRYIGSFFIVQDNTEEVKRTREEFYRTSHDSLTGFYNREYFYAQSIKRLRKDTKTSYLMVCVDIGNFDMVTSLFGRRMGNELLIQASKLLRDHISPEDIYGRFISGKFVILMKKSDFTERDFLKIWENPGEKNIGYPLNVRVGVYEIESPFIPAAVMCDRAILAMGTIKDGETIAYYTNELHENFMREQELQGELINALENGELRVGFKPVLSPVGEMLGARTEIRWEHPEKGVILPEEFFPIFEKNGMIAQLNLYQWEAVCRRLSEWKTDRNDIYIVIKISSKDFYFQDLYQIFTGLAEKYGISQKNLRLEIAQEAHMIDMGYQLAVVNRLRDAGFIVEMDDLGNAYVSLLEERATHDRKSEKDAAAFMEVTEFEKKYM